MRRPFLLILAMSVAVAEPAWSQGASEKAAAEALFAEGRRLMGTGNHTTACEKFEASQKLDPALGTMLNLADCYEKSGRTASAWAIFHEAASVAGSSGAHTRREFARARAANLEQRLSSLTIRADAGIRVLRDGRPMEPAILGIPIPIDPGRHTIDASAPGRKPWSKTVEVKGDAERVEVQVPELAGAPTDTPLVPSSTTTTPGSSSVAPSAHGSPTTPPPRALSPESGRQNQQILAVGVGVVGLVGVGLGIYFGTRAASLWSDAKSHCDPYPTNCPQAAEGLSSDAYEAGNLATVSSVVGLAGLAGAALLWLSAPRAADARTDRLTSPTSSAPKLQVGLGSVVLRGQF